MIHARKQVIKTMNQSSSRPFLTIVIPAWNEEKRLPVTLPRVLEVSRSWDFGVEVLVVDNASTDRTSEIVREIAAENPVVSLQAEPIQGKGAAVRKGMLEGQGEYLFIFDADMAMPVEEVVNFLPPRLTDCDIAIGSREAKGAVRYDEPWRRHVMGRVFNGIVRMFAIPGIQDTQCGFKCFKREVARELFSIQRIDGWAFDVEVLYIAKRREYRIKEVPINWYFGQDSRVSPMSDSVKMFNEVLKIRRNGRRGQYDR